MDNRQRRCDRRAATTRPRLVLPSKTLLSSRSRRARSRIERRRLGDRGGGGVVGPRGGVLVGGPVDTYLRAKCAGAHELVFC